MDFKNLPQDDLLDVIEMTRKLDDILDGCFDQLERNLAISAIMNSTINSVLSRCKTFEEVLVYRQVFFHFFDQMIGDIKIKDD